MSVYLISEQRIKDNTVVNDNVDPKLIAPAILEAQDIHIQSIIGSQLYQKIKTLVVSGTIATYNGGTYLTLLDTYIRPSLQYYTMYELVIPMTIKLMNKSIASRTGEFSNPVTKEDFQIIQENFKNKAEFYGERLIDFLRDNSTTYPEYSLTSTSGYAVIYPKKSSYTSGMYLGDDDECTTLLPH